MNTTDLAAWIQQRRWYAAKSYALDDLQIISSQEIPMGEESITHMILATTSHMGSDHYQLLLRQVPREYAEKHVAADSIITSGEVTLVELFGDPAGLLLFLDAFNEQAASGDLRFHSGSAVATQSVRVITTEQSNSSAIFGDEVIVKFYRRLTPGLNPDLEIGRALDHHECLYVPRVRGWVEGVVDGTPTTLAVMHQFFATAVDGFEYALTSVRDLIVSEVAPSLSGGDFASESERLGEAVAAIHADLQRAFGFDTAASDIYIDEMLERLSQATSEVPALAPYQEQIARIYDSYRGQEFQVQRIHGDLHLGQVLRDISGWKILDFEGEPTADLAHRRQFGPAVRDVAGLLRSFDYAARQPLISHPEADRLLLRTELWTERNRAAFLRGYGPSPESRLFELDKAVYEAVYEHRFRPDWIGIPLGGIFRLLGA